MRRADPVQELSLLNERCTYLRRTHTSLRQGRNGLHARMLRYLRTPQTSQVFRQSIAKQVEALAELDLSIDDWVARLEQADSRRNRIQQKLVEHYAAASTLPTGSTAPLPPSAGVHTPPRSPGKWEELYSKQRRDVQSIRIYADSGVAALLRAIEQEIDLVDAPSSAT